MASVAALLGDPARANILAALMDGRALTAKELAFAAHVSPQTASGHLARLTDASLLAAEKQGRHRYFRLASPLVGQMLESVMAVAGPETRTPHGVARRRGAANGAHLLRPPRRAARRGAGGFADRSRPLDPVPRRRRSHAERPRLPATTSAPNRRPASACSAARAWIGANAALISPAASALPSPPAAWTSMDRAPARLARRDDHRRRHARLRRDLRRPHLKVSDNWGGFCCPVPPEPRLSLMQRRRAPHYRWHL